MPVVARQPAQDTRPLRISPRPLLGQDGGGGQVCEHQCWHRIMWGSLVVRAICKVDPVPCVL